MSCLKIGRERYGPAAALTLCQARNKTFRASDLVDVEVQWPEVGDRCFARLAATVIRKGHLRTVPLGEFPADKIPVAIDAIWSAVAAAETAGDGTVNLRAVLEGVA